MDEEFDLIPDFEDEGFEDSGNDLYGPLPIPEDAEPIKGLLYTVTLSDGTELTDLKLSGNNFISESPVTAEQFEYNLSPVTISDGTNKDVHENMELNHLQVIDGKYYFVLLDLTPQEIWQKKVEADMMYISMMTAVDLDI